MLCFLYDECDQCSVAIVVFCQAEDGIRDLVRSRGLGDVYKRQAAANAGGHDHQADIGHMFRHLL